VIILASGLFISVCTHCTASDSTAQTQFELCSILLPRNKSNYRYMCCSTHCSCNTLSKSSYKQKRNGRKL